MPQSRTPLKTKFEAPKPAPRPELETFDFLEQGSEDWLKIRAGLATASEFQNLMRANGKDSKTRRTYQNRLAAEIITGEPTPTYTNADMERGKEWEPEARNLYSMLTGRDLKQIGFMRRGRVGCSPDSLIEGEKVALEVKTQKAELLIDRHREIGDGVPPEYYAQCQGIIWIADLDAVDLMVYSRKLPVWIRTVHRDQPYIDKLASEVDEFLVELDQLVKFLRGLR
jgi:hypothetical protein